MEKRDATAAVTIPLGANQAKKIFSLAFKSLPIVAIEIEKGRTIIINISTETIPPQPRGLNSPKKHQKPKGKSTVIANCANSPIKLSNLSLSIISLLPTINPAATEAGSPDSGKIYSQSPYTRKINLM